MYKRIDLCQVHVSRRLIDAMWAIDRGAVEIALVVDDEQRLVGTLTDGDIRRALLNGAAMEAPLLPFVHRNFVSVTAHAGRAEVLELMQARVIGQVPVLDSVGRLVGLHLLHELLGCIERPNWAVIMAGGRGTRLAPLTDDVPKPMLPVAGRPILERLILHLVSFGIRRVFLSINYLGHVIEQHFGGGERLGCQIEYLREAQPLGTGGALSLLPEPPTSPIVVLNGDLVTQADLGAMLQFHERGAYQITLAVKQYYHRVPYGCVQLRDDQVVVLEEKPVLSQLVNAGIYVLAPEISGRVPCGKETPLTYLIEDSLARSERVGAFQIPGDWIDVGQRDQLRLAQHGYVS